MSLRLSALLCLTGLAGCSNSANPTQARDPSYVNEPPMRASSDPMEHPARLEHKTAAPTPSPDARPTAAGTPLIADTKGTNPNDFKSTGDAPKRTEPAATGVAPDNTKVNERDRNSAALTPMDQGNGTTDLKLTQQIRQAVMADGSLSFTAKNVKIITQNGKVTLRGPVNSEQERSSIDAAARKVAGATNVDNQLEIKK